MNDNYFHVDAFIGQGLRGNPAGVCLLECPLATAQMQATANELNLPETSFVWMEGGQYAIRWFTPTREVDLCGHATLASAHVLLNIMDPTLEQVHFCSASGELHVMRDAADSERLILDFPSRPAQQIAEPTQVAELLGVEPQEVWQATALMMVLANEGQVNGLQPQISALIDKVGRGVIVTAPGDTIDFVSRYFSLDRSEDPVTGSAHCTLMPYWAARLGKAKLHARQISPRGGELFCEQKGERTLLGGYSRVFLRGKIRI